VVRAPNADLSRDPRWGRTEESYGEDPFLVRTLTVAFAQGLQGPDPKHWQAASLMKHFPGQRRLSELRVNRVKLTLHWYKTSGRRNRSGRHSQAVGD
jgi:beta-glucosidase-like glycosyl hydrolase